MNKMTCVIIEDEPLAAGILEDYIQCVSFLKLKAVFSDAISAIDYLRASPADLYFVDIHLPGLKGLDLLREIGFKGQVIVTSAYEEYALQAYDLNAVDYLLKPVSQDRFMKGIQKAFDLFAYKRYQTTAITPPIPKPDEAIYFKSGNLIHKVDVTDITHFEKKGNYFALFTTTGRKILVRFNFSDLIRKLPSTEFLRVHKSYIVNLRHIDTIENNYIIINKEKIPVSLSFKDEFMKKVAQKCGMDSLSN